MTAVDSRILTQTVTIKPKSASACRFIAIIAFGLFATASYILFREPIDSLGDPSEELVIKTVPKVSTKLEGIDPDERDVFQGFQTSFLPAEEILLASKHCNSKNNIYEGNVISDNFIWGAENKDHLNLARVKRRSHYKIPSHADKEESSQSKNIKADDHRYQNDNSRDKSEEEEEYEIYDDNSGHYERNESIQTEILPETHIDRGPLDDVIEQVRGQPELEEGEMGSSAHLFKPSRIYSGIHAYWKDQGNKETIRQMQARIMKQYMDDQADPCHDYYQYACGNWPSLNPIPADKAGYDTFEMLRENLDTVLKELLEINRNQQPSATKYPSSHLYLDNIFLKQSLVLQNNIMFNRHTISLNNMNKSEIMKRIRRYLDRKAKKLSKPLRKMKYHVHRMQHAFSNNMSKNTYNTKLSKRDIQNVNKKVLRNNFFLVKNINGKTNRLKVHSVVRKKRQDHEADIHVTDDIDNLSMKTKDVTEDATLKAKYLFRSCMNYKILKHRGHQPLLDLLDLLGGWPILDPKWNKYNFDWLELMAKLRLYNNDLLISEWVGPDIKNSDEFVIQFDQTSLGLPTRDYYLQDSNKVYLEAYRTYMIKIAILLGGDKAYVKKSADKLIEFETKLAKITSAPEDRRNVSELYRRMPLKQLEKLVPEIKWQRYLCVVMNRTVSPDETVVLFALNYVKHLVQLIQKTDSSVLANYLLWRFVRHRVNNLDDRFQTVKQQFYFILFGREQSPPRWKNCISQVNSNMGMALGSMFVRKYFDEKSKNDTLTMTREIQQSFKEILHMIDWIDDGTKKLAAHKGDAMMLRIGYPSFILNKQELDDRYKEINIHPDKYFENILNILRHLTQMEQSRIGQPVNKTLWNTAPAVVNAYYSRNKNQIMFPAGILQPPFYHRHFPRSLNYGGIGVVIGHEITHGFDDKGRLFDCDGNLHRWWSDSAIEAFHHRAQCLIDQYGKYVVPEVNMKLDGTNTQGENIADNGGVKQAFRAYTKWLKKHGAEGETLPGLNQTHKQLFFLNFAQVWCGAMRPEAMRNKLKTAVHSPGRFRVIGTLSNSHDFAREYHCAPGTTMNPINKCAVW